MDRSKRPVLLLLPARICKMDLETARQASFRGHLESVPGSKDRKNLERPMEELDTSTNGT
jgi:hypothetical protein